MAGDTIKELKVEEERIGGATLVVPPCLPEKLGETWWAGWLCTRQLEAQANAM